MTDPFVFLDLRTRDLPSSRRFYTQLFGWEVADVPAGPTSLPMFGPVEHPWGGFTALPEGDRRRPQWVPYAGVQDLDAAIERALQLGGTVVRSRTELPQGSVALVEDPGGAVLALWEAKP